MSATSDDSAEPTASDEPAAAAAAAGDRPAPGGRPLVLVPGLGADHRLFGPQLARFGDRVHVPAWPEPGRGDDCAAYAGRLADALPAAIADARPVLAGMSFGGQLVIEMARRVDASAVAVIAGCRRPSHLPARFAIARRAGAPVPAPIARAVLRGLAGVFARRERLDAEATRLVRAMAADVDPGPLRTLARVCADWRDESPPPAPLHALHGDRDWVIPLVPGPEVEVIAGARHLLPLTHPDRVDAFLARVAGD